MPGHYEDMNNKEAKKPKVDPTRIWKDLEQGRNYKSSENLYNIIGRNERMYSGDQWHGINSKNLHKTVYNFLGQLVDVKVASVMANLLTINRRADLLDAEDKTVQAAAMAFEEADKKNWERLKMDSMNEQVLLDSALAGIGCSYWFWDDDIKTGNTFVSKGDIKGELLDSVQLYVSNPNEVDIQKQDWIIVSVRKTVKQLREMAKRAGVSEDQIEMIKGDETRVYEAYDKAQNDQDNVKSNSDQGMLNIKFWKKDGKVFFAKTTKDVVIKDATDSELTLYPLALMTWKPRKRFIYGEAEITYIVSNQLVVNKQESIRHLHAMLMGIPKVIVNETVVNGFTNAVGAVHKAKLPPGSPVSNAISYIQPTQMTIDVDKSIEEGIDRTQSLHGVNRNILGAARPENAQAQLTQIKQSNIPLESIRRRFHQYIEDVALIWLDFYQHKYKLVRKIATEEGEVVEFTGTDFADIYLKTAIDVGADTQWSEILQFQALNDMWDRGIFSPQVPPEEKLKYVERLPDNLINKQQEMIESLGGGEQQEGDEVMFELMAQFLERQPPEIQQQIQSLPPEQQEQAVKDLIRSQMGAV